MDKDPDKQKLIDQLRQRDFRQASKTLSDQGQRKLNDLKKASNKPPSVLGRNRSPQIRRATTGRTQRSAQERKGRSHRQKPQQETRPTEGDPNGEQPNAQNKPAQAQGDPKANQPAPQRTGRSTQPNQTRKVNPIRPTNRPPNSRPSRLVSNRRPARLRFWKKASTVVNAARTPSPAGTIVNGPIVCAMWRKPLTALESRGGPDPRRHPQADTEFRRDDKEVVGLVEKILKRLMKSAAPSPKTGQVRSTVLSCRSTATHAQSLR